jgi:hypothetical protein
LNKCRVLSHRLPVPEPSIAKVTAGWGRPMAIRCLDV